ncbi:hypothetical protein [Bacillus salipaludis]|uniref:hypothetical protein n=1 Tax=Bacillus salipaludis TaxID=2547811 RepID=UPI002E1EDE2C|nr:hypothetical protein [Bacillus salipaludis]
MNKKSIIILFFLMIGTLLTACGNDPVKGDLQNYVNKQTKPLAKKEKEVINLYESVTGANYTNDKTTYNTMVQEVIPKYRDYIAEVESIRPKTKEVRDIHEIYLKAVNLQNSAFIMIVSAIEEQDLNKINEANNKLTEARKLMREYQNALKELAKKHDLTFEIND